MKQNSTFSPPTASPRTEFWSVLILNVGGISRNKDLLCKVCLSLLIVVRVGNFVVGLAGIGTLAHDFKSLTAALM